MVKCVHIDVQPKTDDNVTGSQMKWVIKFFPKHFNIARQVDETTGIIHVNSIQIDRASCVIKSQQGVYII